MSNQIKSKVRVSEHGEVYTDQREVNAMLDLVKKEASRIDSTFLEPACGNGNFLAEIMARKMDTARKLYRKNRAEFEVNATKAISCIYGVDIQKDNVIESIDRMYDNFIALYIKLFNTYPTDGCQRAIQFVLARNIQWGNTLTHLSGDGNPLIISEWALDNEGCFTRMDYNYQQMVESGCQVMPIKVYKRTNMAWLSTQD